ncbi:E3 ubiquitin-protein ligase parkin isoform X2 [Lingula anatina]|uniref:E3 ubiquitin-protein ligase parkin n=1 Tax=Lingula anatina TaxID=7574 RepID=A0A1S3IQ93_LINAN|nr:E3 ubiquitin-protein ligase parkin isoform X2 [Lingula anatina]|eukprot:XP_013400387.1 E3 ubiquitin-protein ligase parkin isoform X2 [Lingula anatina]
MLGNNNDCKIECSMTAVINIRFNSCHSHLLHVDSSWTIEKVKEQIAAEEGVSPNDIRIIFAGRELQNSTAIREIDLGLHSVLHVIQGRKRNLSLQVETDCERGQGEVPETEKEQSTPLNHYYIFCKNECKKVCAGKLRVRCSKCKQGSFRLEQEPSCWDDVLKPGRIMGVCEEKDCSGDTAEFFFKCANHSSTEDESSVVLYLIKANTRNVECITCLAICDPVLVFPCLEGHSMCLDCFRIYCQTKLNDRDFIQHPELGYTLPCPAGCDNSLINEVHHFRILGDDQYDRYQRFSTEECLLQMGGVLCPQPGCGAGLLPEDEQQRRIECATPQGCGFIFCRRCFQAFHQGDCDQRLMDTASTTGYSVDPARAERARWERLSKDTIGKTTKPCPQCNVPVEKAGGCMHMQCTRCKLDWCWLCHSPWSRECMGNHWFG